MTTRMELLQRYLQEDPDDSFLRYALALEWLGAGDYQKAMWHLEEVLAADPGYLAAYYQAGITSLHLGNKTVAVHYFEKGLDVSKAQNDNHTYRELASALEQLKEDEAG